VPSHFLPNALVRALVAGALAASVAPVGRALAQTPGLPSETPAKFKPATSTFDYEAPD
jgi:hypothetical protein